MNSRICLEDIKKYQVDSKSFQIVKQIQQGGFGTVFLVQNVETKEKIVAKVLFDQEDEKNFKKLVNREIGIMIFFQQPTFAKFIGYSFKDFYNSDQITLFMRYEKNGSLASFLKKARQGTLETNFDNTSKQILLIGIALSVKILHSTKICHRDLKPANILLDDNYHPLLTDFGLSTNIENSCSRTKSRECGTNIYMPPECYTSTTGAINSAFRDVYSFGIIMYEIITGRVPYPELTSGKITSEQFIYKVINENHRPKFIDPIKPSLKQLMEQCWSQDPRGRPSFEIIFNKLAYGIEGTNFLSNFDIFGDIKNTVNDKYYLEDVDNDAIQTYLDEVDEKRKIEQIIEQNKHLIMNQQQFEEIKLKNKDLELEKREMIQNLLEMEKNLNKEKKEKIEMAHKCDDLQKEITRIQKEKEEITHKCGDLQKEITKIQKEKEEMTHKYENSQKEITRIQKEKEEMTHKYENSQKEITKIQKEKEEITHKYENSQKENIRIQKENEEIKEIYEDVLQENTRIQKENEEIKEKYEDVQNENEEIKGKYSGLVKVNKKLKQNNNELKDKNEKCMKYEEQFHKKEQENNELKIKNKSLISKNKKLTDEINRLSQFERESEIKTIDPVKKSHKRSQSVNSMPKKKYIPIVSSDHSERKEHSKSVIYNYLQSQQKIESISILSIPEEDLSPFWIKVQNLLKYLREQDDDDDDLDSFISIIKDKSSSEISDENNEFPIYLHYKVVEMLINTHCPSLPEFVNIIGKFKNIAIEIKYKSKMFEPTLDFVKSMKETNRNNIKISLLISEIDIIDMKFRNDHLFSFIRFDSSVIKIKGNKKNGGSFYGCKKVEEISFSSSVNKIGSSAFKDCFSLRFVTFDEFSSLSKIGSSAFNGCNSLEKITIPSSVIEIDDNAFQSCGSLKEVTINSSLNKVGESLFRSCTNLCHIKLNSIPQIPKYCFAYCSSLSKIVIPKSCTLIGNSAFFQCSELVEITIPDSVTIIEERAFEECYSLQQISISKSVISIGKNSFNNCISLKNVLIDIGSQLISFENYLFSGCRELEEISIPSSVTKIDSFCFSGCDKLKMISLPSSITEIGNKAFSSCKSLEKVIFDEGSSSFTSFGENAFSNCISLEEISIPYNIKSIKKGTFYNCKKLNKIVIPLSVESIGEDSFKNCISLTQFNFTKSLKVINNSAFEGCLKLTPVLIPSSVKLKNNPFPNNTKIVFT